MFNQFPVQVKSRLHSTYSESPLSRPARSFLTLLELDLERERLKERDHKIEEVELQQLTHLRSLLRLRLCLCLCLSLDRDLLRLCLRCLSLDLDLSRYLLRSRDLLRLRRLSLSLSLSRSRLLSSTSRRPNPDLSSFFTAAPPPLAISSIFASLFNALLTSIVFSNFARSSLILMKPRWSLPPK